ncbi:hypothetical protein [Cryobacterium melibiosiphilum]|nr:hypothetical protein [Cryobacterium melibiosiphilum]
MPNKLTSLEEIANLVPRAFEVLAGITDKAIQRAISERQSTRGGRRNPAVFHGGVREAILMDVEGLTELEKLGITVTGGQSDSLSVRISGRLGLIGLTHRPKTMFSEDFSLGDDGLFPRNTGRACLFYSSNFTGLARFTLVETNTAKEDFFLHGCEVIDEIEFDRVALAPSSDIDPETTNEHDNLDDIFPERGEGESYVGEGSDVDTDEFGDATAV